MTTFDASKLVALRRVTTVAASPDGTWLAVAAQRLDRDKEAKYVSDLWRVPLDGGEPVQLTRGKWNDHSPAFRHDGSLAFLSNRLTGVDDDHDKRAQVFVFHPWGGEPKPLTDEPLGVQSFRTAANSDVLCVITPLLPDVELDEQRERVKERREKGPTELVYDRMPVRFWDHWLPTETPHLVAYRDGARTDLWPDVDRELLRASFDVAPDGSFVVVHPGRRADDRINDQYSLWIDVAEGERRILASEDRAWFSSPCISPDGRKVAMAFHQREPDRYGTSHLVVVDATSGEIEHLANDWDDELAPVAWTPDGTHVLATGAYRTHRPVFAVDVENDELHRITRQADGGTHLSVVVVPGDELRIAGVRSSTMQPPEPFICDAKPESEVRVVANISGFDGVEGVEIENHTVESTDGTPVQYHVVRPAELDGESSTVMWIHGGPISDWGDVWHWRWNPLVAVAEGHVMVLPNPRGSVGFGNDFIEGIWHNSWGGQCYEDLMAVADQVAARDDVDAAKMVAMGGSFGGYMTNWIGTQTDRFACLVTHASLFDLAAFHGTTDAPAWWAHSFGVHPYEERPAFDLYSPLAHVANWESPVLIIHGEKDYRVPVGEALAMFEALDFHGVDARLLIYPDENHWILRPKNIESWYGHVFGFIGEHVG